MVRDVPEPVCGEEEAVLEVRACAICGSDLRIYRYGNERVKLPAIMGHEIAGVITAVGPKAVRLAVGDRVAVGADVPCGTCHWCANGMGTNCRTNTAIGYQFPGGFQERMVLGETVVRYGPVTPIPDDLAFEEAALAEPLACALNGLELGEFRAGKTVGIIGLGPIGCMMLELAAALGAGRVFAVQRSRRRLEMARPFNPDARFICTEDEDPVETVMKETGGEGLDFVVTTAGTTLAQEWAIRMVRHRGYVNLFAGLKNQPPLTIDSNIIHYREAFVMGSHGSLPRHHRMAVDLIARGRVSAGRYISRRFPLDAIEEAFAYHESRQGLKVVVQPNGSRPVSV